MRTLLTFILVTICLSSLAQTQKDTIECLKKISATYFTKMYVDKDVDSAIKMWDKSTFENLEAFYKAKKRQELNDSSITSSIKLAYAKYLQTISAFTFTLFGYHVVEDNATRKIIALAFYYRDADPKKSDKMRTSLFFVTYNNGNTWKIQDTKALEIAEKYYIN